MLLDNHYAPDRRVEYEASLLQEHDVHVRVIAWDRRTDPASDDSPAEVDVVRLNVAAPPGGGVRSGVAMLRFSRGVWARRAELLADADVLVVHDIYLLALGWLLARTRSLPFVYDAHEEYARMEAARYPPWLLRIATAVETALARGAICIVVPGAARVRRWASRGFENVLVLRNIGRDSPIPNDPDVMEWDILHAGTLSDERRLDLLLEVATNRPDLRIAIAGSGRLQDDLQREARSLPNVSFLGWRKDLSDVIVRSRSLYYGLEPTHPDAETACPNTLYQALRHRRPIVFFRGGEIDELAQRFCVGVRTTPTAHGLADAVDRVRAGDAWEFEAAWESLAREDAARDFVAAIVRAAPA
jgi:glycosyltransferase involved in cell wall biosynthesis